VSTILDKIVATKRKEVAIAKTAVPESVLREQIAAGTPPCNFLAALQRGARGADIAKGTCVTGAHAPFPSVSLIAEIKRASPSRGLIRHDFQPVDIAKTYRQHGANCISVLTDESYFQGSLDVLRQVRSAVDLPLLRKDFVIDPYQVLQARAAGADAVLLIAECLDDAMLATLHDAICDLHMTPLVELHDAANLTRVLAVGAKLIGINNRNLHTFKTDLDHTLRLRAEVPADRTLVSESGIRTQADVWRLADAGVDAMLVGESLMAQPDIGAAVDKLLGACC